MSEHEEVEVDVEAAESIKESIKKEEEKKDDEKAVTDDDDKTEAKEEKEESKDTPDVKKSDAATKDNAKDENTEAKEETKESKDTLDVKKSDTETKKDDSDDSDSDKDPEWVHDEETGDADKVNADDDHGKKSTVTDGSTDTDGDEDPEWVHDGDKVQEVLAASKKQETKSGEVKQTVVPGLAVEDDGIRVVGVHISEMRVPLVAMFVSAVILLCSVFALKSPTKWPEYAISVPSVTGILSFLLILLTCKKDVYQKIGKIPNQILFLWNFIGAVLLTFIDPFTGTGNGYFASWMMVVCSAGALGLSHSVFTTTVRGMGALLGLLSCSIIVIIAVAPYIGEGEPYRYESIYTLTTASFTLAVILLHIFLEKKKGIDKSGGSLAMILLGFFACLWLALAGLTTFRGPFLVTGNGFFGAWAGAACAGSATMAAKRKKQDEKHEVES